MTRKIINVIVLVLVLLNINNVVNAEQVCNQDEKKRLKTLAEKVEIFYDYEMSKENTEEGVFVDVTNRINVNNMNEELKVVIADEKNRLNYREIAYNESKSNSVTGFEPGEKVNIEIRAYVANACSGEKLISKKITIPYYNGFYDGDECKEYPDFEYCQNELVERPYSFKTFYSKLDEYINNSAGKGKIGSEKDNISFEKILTIALVTMAILAVIYVSYLKVKKRIKENSL